MNQLSTRVLLVPLILLCVHGYLCGQDVIPRINNGFEIIHQPWHLVSNSRRSNQRSPDSAQTYIVWGGVKAMHGF